MITNGIKLDMYLAPPSEAVFAALGASLRAVLTEAGIDLSASFGAGFAVGQVCGITYATAPAGRCAIWRPWWPMIRRCRPGIIIRF